jgi:hypothetical protein
MRFLKLLFPAILALPLSVVACGDDDSDGDGDGNGEAGSSSSMGGSGNEAGSGTSKAGTTSTGNGGEGGGAPATDKAGCEAYVTATERKALPREIDDTFEATADTIWEINDQVFVSGTLNVEPGTCFEGSKDPVGVLIVQQGGALEAVGTADEPIIFTSAAKVGERAPEDWGGIVLLGQAPLHDAEPTSQYEGLVGDQYTYGGDVANDSSGSLEYVRIEFSGFEINADEEINGLTFAGVGSGTTVNNVMVTNTSDDCFEWFGGTVSTTNLIANNCGDDFFDTDEGHVAAHENWFGRTTEDFIVSENPNGFEWDGILEEGMPQTQVAATNVTLCGPNVAELAVEPTYAMVLREGITGLLDNVVMTGFDGGVDVRDDFGTPAAPNVTITNSQYWGLLGDFAGTSGMPSFNEDAWFAAGTGNEADPDPAPFTPEECLAEGGPAAAVKESEVGAFTASATWADGAWVNWATK